VLMIPGLYAWISMGRKRCSAVESSV